MSASIDVYVRSRVIPSDLTALMYSYDCHYYFEQNYRGIYHWLRERGWSKGRVFEQDSADLLFFLVEVVKLGGERARVHDLGQWRGRVRALLAGVRRTPAVVVAGRRYVGLAAAREALRRLGA